ncbi:MAG: ketoacyl-ACP synthase III [Chlamydiales bacterium]
MAQITKARIVGTGTYLPKKVMTNHDFEKIVETSDEWIYSRTGIKERRIAEQEENPSDMGAVAAQRALEDGGIDPKSVDLIITATMSPDFLCPSTANLIQHKIGASYAGAFDLGAACSGYLYGLSVAKAFIESGIYNTVLLVATEKMSSLLDYQDRKTCVLFGDGAAAAVISSQGRGLSIEALTLGADGSQQEVFKIPAGGSACPASYETLQERQHYVTMSGRELFKHAVRRMQQAAEECITKAQTSLCDIRWVIPHQANVRIIEALAKQMTIDPEKMCYAVQEHGNTSAASIGIALQQVIEQHSISPNEQLLLVAFGAGLSWGAALLKQEEIE